MCGSPHIYLPESKYASILGVSQNEVALRDPQGIYRDYQGMVLGVLSGHSFGTVCRNAHLGLTMGGESLFKGVHGRGIIIRAVWDYGK